jgi:hypothetical protein
MAQRNRNLRPVQASDSIIEQARRRRRKAAKLYNFNDLFDGKREREHPQYGRRDDGTMLFYPGKENALYGETEAGKDMLLAMTVMDCLEEWKPVAWIDFEEGNEIDTGQRLMEMGAPRDAVCDQDLFMFSTPEDVDSARDSMFDALTKRVEVVVFNGIQSAYGLFGWDLFDPTSPALFRQNLVVPLISSGCAVIGTDHMTKSSAEGKSNGSRYAAGGIAKLNWVNGAAYMLEAMTPIVRGGVGESRLILTKDRPGDIKPRCSRIDNEPRMMYAGKLVVKSTADGPLDDEETRCSLNVTVANPAPGSVVRARRADAKAERDGSVTEETLERVLAIYKQAGRDGLPKRAVVSLYSGKGHSKVMAAIDILQAHGCIVKAGKSASSNIAPLRYAKAWDPKQKIGGDDE